MPNDLVLNVSQSLDAPPPARVQLAMVLVAPYQTIRVLSFCRSASVGNVVVTLTHVEGEAAVAALDRFTLSPGATINQAYPVPGVVLAVSAEAVSDAPTAVDVVIWGYRNSAEGSPPLNPDVPSKVDGP